MRPTDRREVTDAAAEPARPRATLLPLSHAQTAMWVRWKYSEKSAAFNNPLLFELHGDVEVTRLTAACSALVDRYDVLRARFVDIDGIPFQEIVAREQPALEFHDLTELPEAARERRKDEILAGALQAPFDLSRDVVYRFALVRMAAHRHYLAMNIHHIAVDGVSASILLAEIAADYDGTAPPPRAGASIARFLEFEHDQPPAGREDAERYWGTALEHARPNIDFAAIQRNDVDAAAAGAARFSFRLPAAAHKAVAQLAKRTHSTLFTVLSAAFEVLLWRYTGQTELTLVYPVDIRPRGLKAQFGCMINYLPLALTLRPEMTVAELIQAAVEARTSSRPHSTFPHLEISRLARRRGSTFNAGITAANLALGGFSLRGLDVRPHLVFSGDAKEDISLLYDSQGDDLVLLFEYRRALFRDEVIAEMAADFAHLLGEIAAGDNKRLRDLMLAGDRALAARFSAADAEPSEDLWTLLEARLLHAGDRIVGKDETRAISGHSLLRLTQGAAELLRQRGVRPGDRVAVQLSRSLLLLPSILAIWKLGAIYVPIDPELPPARSRFILDDAAPRVVLTDADVAALPERAVVAGGATPDADVAYLIYTSGSTGTPKGVEVTRGNLCSFWQAMAALLPLGADSRLLAVTTIGFDISLLELFLPLIAGATVIIYPSAKVRDPFAVPELLQRERVNVLQATPSYFRMLIAAGWSGKPDLVALVGGENLEAGTAETLLRGCHELWNLYGPTETTVWSMAARITDAAAVHLGRPIAGTAIDLLGPGGMPVPRYGRGEIYIRGLGVARGYRGRLELTQQRFVELPGLGRAYRTGDIAQRMGDDTIRYVGRADGQLKIRGFRVELGEIENRIEMVPTVKKAVVIASTHDRHELELAAFVERVEGATLDDLALRTQLAEFLPHYMLPSTIRFVDAWPLGAGGKIDRQALAGTLPSAGVGLYAGQAIAASVRDERATIERGIARIYAEMLGAEPADPTRSLFELGGHSLLGARIVARIREELSLVLPFQEFMADSSLEGIIRLASTAVRAPRSPAAPSADELVPTGKALPLPSGSARVLLSDRVLGRNHQHTLGRIFRIEGALDPARLRQAVESARLCFMLDGIQLDSDSAQAVRGPADNHFWNQIELEVPEQEVVSLCRRWLDTPLDPARGRLFKCLLVSSGAARWYLALAAHHAALDGASCHGFLKALSATYVGSRVHDGFSVADTRQFAEREADHVEAGRAAAIRHFTERFEGWRYFELGSALAPHSPNANRTLVLEIAPAHARTLSSRLGAPRVGPFAWLVTLLARALAEHKRVADVCLGVVHSLRGTPALDRVFGNLTNILPLHLRSASTRALAAIASEAQTQLVADREHAGLPFQALLDAFPRCRQPGLPPMSSVLAVEEVVGDEGLSFGSATTVSSIDHALTTNLYDLTVRVRSGERWQIGFDYNTTRVDRATIVHLARAIETAAAGAGGGKLIEHNEANASSDERTAATPRVTAGPGEIAAVIDEVLGSPTDPDRSFLAAGGNSILATKAVALLRARLGIEARVLDLLGAPAIRVFVASLAAEPAAAPASSTEVVAARAQEKGIFFIQQVASCKAAYNIPLGLRIEPPLAVDRLRQTLDAIVAAEPVLRTGFLQTADGVVKIIRPPAPALLEPHGLVDEEQLRATAEELVRRPFDLEHDALLRAHHFSLGPGGDALIFVFHHLIADGVSTGNFLRRLAAAYAGVPLASPSRALAANDPPEIDQLLAEFPVRDQRAALPYARPFPPARTLEGEFYEVKLSADCRRALGELGSAHGTPMSALMLSAVSFALHHVSRERSINIGVATANRSAATTDELGLHTNTVVLPCSLNPEEPVSVALGRIARDLFAVCRYSDLPLQDVVTRIVEEPDLGVTPLFQVFYNFIDRGIYAFAPAEFRAAEIPLRPVGSKFELSFEVHDLGETMSVVLEYSSDVYERATVAAMGELLRRILQTLSRARDWSLARLLRSVR
jgi:amino acid adenylation domain-containing protein